MFAFELRKSRERNDRESAHIEILQAQFEAMERQKNGLPAIDAERLASEAREAAEKAEERRIRRGRPDPEAIQRDEPLTPPSDVLALNADLLAEGPGALERRAAAYAQLAEKRMKR